MSDFKPQRSLQIKVALLNYYNCSYTMAYKTVLSIDIQDNSTNTSTNDYFSQLFENRSSKIIGVILTWLSICVYIPLLYSIIYYEKFGSDKKRTVLNKLVSSICWCGIYYNLLSQVPEMICYCFGPLPPFICYLHFVIKNIIAIQVILFYDSITILRYLFIFWLKNPSNFCDNFWTTYLNFWITTFATISQVVHTLIPGTLYY